MRLTLVIATLNAARTVENCLGSICQQTWQDLEVVIADGGSTDNTLDVVAETCHERCKILAGPDDGIYEAWNKALDAITGDWVLFLGADDVLDSPRVLEEAALRMRELGPQIAVAYGVIDLVGNDGRVLGSMGRPWSQARAELSRGMPIPNAATFYRTDLFTRFGRFDTSYRSSGDYEFILRLAKEIEPAFLEDLVVTRIGVEGLSSEVRSTRKRHLEDLRAQRAHGLVKGFVGVLYRRLVIELREGVRRVFGRRAARALANARRHLQGRPLLPQLPARRR